MQIATVDHVLSQIRERASARPRAVVATDGDGTLWSGDVGEDLFHAFVDRGRVEPPAHAQMTAEARAYGFDAGGAPAVLARRLYDAYVAGAYPEERACELMTWCFAGWSRGEVAAFAEEVVARGNLASRLHAELGRVLDGARAIGLEIFVVSASPRAVVEVAARGVGVAASHVVAADARFEGDTMMPDVHRPIPYGPGKVSHLARAIGDRPVLAAFGDNLFDIALLRSAEVAVAVRPKPRLRNAASEVPHLLELAPDK